MSVDITSEPRRTPASSPSASRFARWSLVLAFSMCALSAARVRADDATYTKPQDWLLLLGGAVSGLVLHEMGHLTVDLIADNKPVIRPVALGPLPFFAISPTQAKSSGELYGVAMAGFFVEAVYTELIFANSPDLRYHHQPFLEGMLALHFALDLGYAITGFAGIGPHESDVNTMARAADVSPAAIGTMLALPLMFDLLRYLKPELRNRSIWIGMSARWLMFGGVLFL